MNMTIKPLKDDIKKYVAIFKQGDKTKQVKFGDSNYEDYTTHKDLKRRELYIARHKSREDWTDKMRAGTLSRYLLWGNSTDLHANIRDYKKRFNLL